MDRQGSAADWAAFYATLGRYITAAGNAESWMFRLLVTMCSQAKHPAPVKAPMWAGLVKGLIQEAKGGSQEERIGILLRGALRRGRLRNNIVHTGWFAVGPDGYSGRRHFSNGDGNAVLVMPRAVLEQDLATMEWFENELERLAQDVVLGL